MGHWLVSAITVLLAFYLGQRSRKPRLVVTARTNKPTDKFPIGGRPAIANVHNAGIENAYISRISLRIFGVQTDATFYDLQKRREVSNFEIPANGFEEFFSPTVHVIEGWKSIPTWKKYVAAMVKRLPVKIIVRDAGGNVYKSWFAYPWTGKPTD